MHEIISYSLLQKLIEIQFVHIIEIRIGVLEQQNTNPWRELRYPIMAIGIC